MSRLVARFLRRSFAPACIVALLQAATCSATTITFTEAGVSAAGTPLLVSAKLQTAGDVPGGGANSLRITLRSFGAATIAKADVLSSFYFNLADPNTGVRPMLTYVSGSGQAYEVLSRTTDQPVSWAPDLVTGGGTWTTMGTGTSNPSNLIAALRDNEGWQFKTLMPPPAYPGLGFGIGTVGNSDIGKFVPGASSSSSGFNGRVVQGAGGGDSMINLGIYSTGTGTDIVPNGGLNGARLLRNEAVFNFTSDKDLSSVTQTWVQGNVTFGFGTGPDSVLLPEPGGLLIAAIGCLLAAGWRHLRFRGAGRHQADATC
jgi:hypothetical protein